MRKGEIIRFVDSTYKTIFTIPDGGNIELIFPNGEKEIRNCTYIDDYHTKIDKRVYHICEFAERMHKFGIKYSPKYSAKALNKEFVLNNSNEFKKDKFYVLPQKQTITHVYYNPYCAAGGQLVYNNISFDLVRKASKLKNSTAFFNLLDSECRQTLVDIDTEDFSPCANSFIEDKCDYSELNTNTMKSLISLANAEKARVDKYMNMEREP